jgi:hypothetical protein
MKKTIILFAAVFCVAILGAFTTKARHSKMPGAYCTLGCSIKDKPTYCTLSDPHLCTMVILGTTYTFYQDMNCTTPYYMP